MNLLAGELLTLSRQEAGSAGALGSVDMEAIFTPFYPGAVPRDGDGYGLGLPVVIGGETEIQNQVKSWAAAWSARDYTACSAFYAPTFPSDGGLSREDWAQLRRVPPDLSIEFLSRHHPEGPRNDPGRRRLEIKKAMLESMAFFAASQF